VRLRALLRTQYRRALLQSAQALPRYRNTLRQTRQKFSCRSAAGRYYNPAQLKTGPSYSLESEELSAPALDPFGEGTEIRCVLHACISYVFSDTPSQSVRSSIQLAEPEPVRVSVASLRSMSGERKYHAITFNPARRIADPSAARCSRRCCGNNVRRLLLGWMVARQYR